MEIQEQIDREIQKIITTIEKTKNYKQGTYGGMTQQFNKLENNFVYSVLVTLGTNESIEKYKVCVAVNIEKTKIVNAYYLPIE